MALQRMILVPPELWENRCQAPSPPPVKEMLISKDNNYNKWTQVRMHQGSYLKTEKLKREPIPIPIIETGSSKSSFKTKPERKGIIGSLPLFKTEALEPESKNRLSASAFEVHS